jgi:AcrR family transcriptional regulator
MSVRPERTPRLAPEERRAQLLDSALQVLTEGGFSSVTVETIAKQAGVTRPVIYDTFGDLESLMLALIDRTDEDAHRALHEIVGEDPPAGVDPEQFLVDSVHGFLRAVQADPRTWRFVLMPPRGNSPELRRRIRLVRREIADRVAALLDWGVATRGGPSGLDHAFLGRLIVAAGEDAARLMLAHPDRFGPEVLASATRDLVALLPTDAERGAGGPPPFPEALPVPPPPQPTGPAPADIGRAAGGFDAGNAGGAGGPGGAGARRQRVPQSERREQLLDVTLELLAESGFGELNVEAIARRAGVNRVVVYRSFANLPVLLAALMNREDKRVRDTLHGLIPQDTLDRPAPEILIAALATLLSAVASQPRTWRVALLRPESAPRALQKIVNLRRAALAQRIEPLVRFVIYDLHPEARGQEVEAVARMLLTIGEEEGRLALDDPEYPPERLLHATWALLQVMAWPTPPGR